MIRLQLFAGLREVFGLAEAEIEAKTVADVLEWLSRHGGEPGRNALRQTAVILNGRNVAHLAGHRTRLQTGDTLTLFPPLGGG